MAMKKSRPKHEFARQIAIAQSAIDWMVQMRVDMAGTRAEKVVGEGGNVEAWAARFIPV
jgi:hypothetical protein